MRLDPGMVRAAALATVLGGSTAAAAAHVARADNTVGVTPHDSYSSSVGVLGCKIDTDRVAYWPMAVDCTNVCVRLSYGGRSLELLRVDQSGGAYDVSYDAWNYLYTGYSATKKPVSGGAVSMTYEDVDASACKGLLHKGGGKLPLSAANSMDYLAGCLGESDSWVAGHYVLYNILDPICTYGLDEKCTLDWPAENQATCPGQLGDPAPLTSDPVYNVEYPSGQTVLASTGQAAGRGGGGKNAGAGRAAWRLGASPLLVLLAAVHFVAFCC
ncbi:hypothetical protein GGR56DRAFT_677675 [Xylariaceae sp. FL0804]|nr:hypothetical protein GGR56DRAFT_677675 [Xylariaceae sp. FL0804]